MTQGGSVREVRYSPPHLRANRYVRWFLIAVIVLNIGRALTQHSWRPVYTLLILLALFSVPTLITRVGKGRDFVADSDRIRRPIVGFDIPWSEVECVIAPSRFDQVVRVRVKGGREKPTGFPREYAERLAEVGRRPLRERRDLKQERARW